MSRKKPAKKMVSYEFPVRVVSALSERARETRLSKTAIVLIALEKDGIPAVK